MSLLWVLFGSFRILFLVPISLSDLKSFSRALNTAKGYTDEEAKRENFHVDK